jgi:nicotinamidase/pyrazinamidase
MINLENYNRAVAIGVDIQNDFAPGGSLAVPEGDRIIQPFNELARKVRCAGGVVALTRDWHPKKTSHFDQWPVHCVAGTEGAQFHPKLRVLPQDLVFNKGTLPDEDAYSGFEGQTIDGLTLEQLITPKDNEKVIVLMGGWATDYCVEATDMDGQPIAKRFPNQLDIYVIEDAIAAVDLNPGDGERAIERMKTAGAIIIQSSDVVLHLIEEHGVRKCEQ